MEGKGEPDAGKTGREECRRAEEERAGGGRMSRTVWTNVDIRIKGEKCARTPRFPRLSTVFHTQSLR